MFVCRSSDELDLPDDKPASPGEAVEDDPGALADEGDVLVSDAACHARSLSRTEKLAVLNRFQMWISGGSRSCTARLRRQR